MACLRIQEPASVCLQAFVLNTTLPVQHIRECVVDAAAVKRFCLLLYASSHLLPSDTAEDISNLRSALEQFLLAVLQRTSKLEMEGPAHFVEVLVRVSRSSVCACSNGTLFSIINLALEALRSSSPGVKHMLTLLSIALSHLLARKGGREYERVLRAAKVKEVLQNVFAMPWPASLIEPVLKSLRTSGLQKENALLPVAESAQEMISIIDAGRNACISIPRADAEHLPDAIEGFLHLVVPLTLQHVKLVCGVLRDWMRHVEVDEATGIAEASALARVTDVLMRNQSLANQWVKSFKSNATHSSFEFSLSLMLCRSPRSNTAQQKTMDALKSSITACLQHQQALQGSQWLVELPHTPHRATRCVAVLLHDLAMSHNDNLISQLIAFAQHLLANYNVKGVQMSQVPYVEDEDYVGLVWWTGAVHSSCLSLAGAAILEQVCV